MTGRLHPSGRRCLHIAEDLLLSLHRHAEKDYPAECCGILVGRRDGRATRVTAVVKTPNLSSAPTGSRYQIAADDLLEAMNAARDESRDVVGYYHSHPDGEALPSQADRAEAWPGTSYLIVAVRKGIARETRSWRFSEQDVDEELIVTGCGPRASAETAP